MGLKLSKKRKNDDLHIVTFNYNMTTNSIYNKNILENFIKNFENKKSIICIQGCRNFINLPDINSYNNYYNNSLGLSIYTNLDIVSKNFITFDKNQYSILNDRSYGFQILDINYKKYKFSIYNLELIPNIVNEINFSNLRKKQILELITYICNNFNKSKIHIITGCFYDYVNNINELINMSEINEVITNLNLKKQENYIFLYNNILNNLEDLNAYLIKKFNIYIIGHKLYNLNISEHCPFEVIIRLKKK